MYHLQFQTSWGLFKIGTRLDASFFVTGRKGAEKT